MAKPRRPDSVVAPSDASPPASDDPWRHDIEPHPSQLTWLDDVPADRREWFLRVWDAYLRPCQRARDLVREWRRLMNPPPGSLGLRAETLPDYGPRLIAIPNELWEALTEIHEHFLTALYGPFMAAVRGEEHRQWTRAGQHAARESRDAARRPMRQQWRDYAAQCWSLNRKLTPSALAVRIREACQAAHGSEPAASHPCARHPDRPTLFSRSTIARAIADLAPPQP